MSTIHLLCIMTTLPLLMNDPLPCRPKSLQCKRFPLLHPRPIPALDYRDRFPTMDLVWVNGVAREISDGFYLVGFPIEFELVGFHCFLDGRTDVAQESIDTRMFDCCVGGVFDCCDEIVVTGVEVHCECAVTDSSVDMDSNIHFHYIVFLQDYLVACVGGVVRCDMVQGKASWEPDSSGETIFFNEGTS